MVLLQAAMILGPNLGYIDQVRSIRKSRSSKGFSNAICGVLLFANILRINFWFGKQFDPVLLYQSLLLVLVQLYLLQQVLEFRPGRRSNFWFWNWASYQSYLKALLGFSLLLFTLNWWLGGLAWYVELLGIASMGIEATLPLPQVAQNYQSKSVKGFSVVVLISWLLGDGFKTFYYLANNTPLQFVACGIFQLIMDLVLVAQTWIYSKNDHQHLKY